VSPQGEDGTHPNSPGRVEKGALFLLKSWVWKSETGIQNSFPLILPHGLPFLLGDLGAREHWNLLGDLGTGGEAKPIGRLPHSPW
jgi:hypothetical protein